MTSKTISSLTVDNNVAVTDILPIIENTTINKTSFQEVKNLITKQKLNIDQLNNTADLDKPLTNSLIFALSNKAPVDHEHSIVTLKGPKSITITTSEDYHITNYDLSKSYGVSVDIGSVTRLEDVITVTAPETIEQNILLTVNNQVYDIAVTDGYVVKPTVIKPTNLSKAKINKPIETSKYLDIGLLSSHFSTDWIVSINSDYSNPVINQINDEVNKYFLNIESLTPKVLHYAKFRYKAASGHYSEWSMFEFTPDASFIAENEVAIFTGLNSFPEVTDLGYTCEQFEPMNCFISADNGTLLSHVQTHFRDRLNLIDGGSPEDLKTDVFAIIYRRVNEQWTPIQKLTGEVGQLTDSQGKTRSTDIGDYFHSWLNQNACHISGDSKYISLHVGKTHYDLGLKISQNTDIDPGCILIYKINVTTGLYEYAYYVSYEKNKFIPTGNNILHFGLKHVLSLDGTKLFVFYKKIDRATYMSNKDCVFGIKVYEISETDYTEIQDIIIDRSTFDNIEIDSPRILDNYPTGSLLQSVNTESAEQNLKVSGNLERLIFGVDDYTEKGGLIVSFKLNNGVYEKEHVFQNEVSIPDTNYLPYGYYGSIFAISSDGLTIATVAEGHTDNTPETDKTNYEGDVFIYKFINNQWTLFSSLNGSMFIKPEDYIDTTLGVSYPWEDVYSYQYVTHSIHLNEDGTKIFLSATGKDVYYPHIADDDLMWYAGECYILEQTETGYQVIKTFKPSKGYFYIWSGWASCCTPDFSVIAFTAPWPGNKFWEIEEGQNANLNDTGAIYICE